MALGLGIGLTNTFLKQMTGGGSFPPSPPVMRELFAILFSSDTADVITDGRGNTIDFRRSP